MNIKATCLTALALAASTAVLVADPASASTVDRYSSCSTSTAQMNPVFHIDKSVGRYGKLLWVYGNSSGEFTDNPAIMVRIRDGYGKIIVTKTGTDGSTVVTLNRRIGGPNWTAQATMLNSASGSCSTPRIKIAVRDAHSGPCATTGRKIAVT